MAGFELEIVPVKGGYLVRSNGETVAMGATPKTVAGALREYVMERLGYVPEPRKAKDE